MLFQLPEPAIPGGESIANALELGLQFLPESPLMAFAIVGFSLLAIAQVATVGVKRVRGGSSSLLFGRSAWKQARQKGYGLPMRITKERNISRIERLGNVLAIPDIGSILAIGATRSGKTETGKWIVDQMRASEDEPMVVYDHKNDYQRFFTETDREFIKLSSSGSTHTWNIFEEIEDDQDASEVARAIFAEAESASGSSGAFFGPAARQVFTIVLKYIHKQTEGTDATATNASLVGFFEENDATDAYEKLRVVKGFRGIASHLEPRAEKKQGGVWSNLQLAMEDVFTGDFERGLDDGEGGFSIREYMKNPQGKALVLDYPYRQGSTTTPIFRLLIDLAAREALVDAERGAYFVLDEAAQIPNLKRLDELVNVGAGRNIQVLITLQSVAQLRANYGEEQASAILSGLTSTMLLRCDDPKSVEFVRAKIGREFTQYTAHVEKANLPNYRKKTVHRESRPEEEHRFSEAEINSWRPGEGVLVRPDSWAFGRVKLFDE